MLREGQCGLRSNDTSMVELFCFETAHHLGDALPLSLRLRHRIFVERQGYEVQSHRGMEYDEFDTPAARYLLWRDPQHRPGAVARMIPTSERYMLRALWPALATEAELPRAASIWEVSRFGIDMDLPPSQRRIAAAEMMCALAEFAAVAPVSTYLFVAHPLLVKSLVAGVAPIEPFGPRIRLGRFGVVAAKVPIPDDVIGKTRRAHRVQHAVLSQAGISVASARSGA